jgi:hypothetical protein
MNGQDGFSLGAVRLSDSEAQAQSGRSSYRSATRELMVDPGGELGDIGLY